MDYSFQDYLPYRWPHYQIKNDFKIILFIL
jgi:hypothetical protein